MANFPTNAATGSIFSTGTNVYRYVGHNQWETISPNIAVGYSEMDQSITGSIETFENTGASAPSTLSVNTLQLDGAHDTSNSSAFSVVGSATKLSSETQQLGNLVLHLQMEGSNNSTTFTDSSKSAHTVTVSGSAKISTDKRIVGVSSGYFDGSGAVTIASTTDVAFGTDTDFTVEMWLYSSTPTGGRVRLDGRTGGNQGPQIDLYLSTAEGNPVWYVDSTEVFESSTALTANTWYHLAVVRSSGTHKMYLNGVEVGSYTSSINYNASGLKIGGWSGGSLYPYLGYIDDLKIYKGFAKYTSAFSVDTRPDHALPTDAPELKIQSKYNNVLTSYKINMTRDKE